MLSTRQSRSKLRFEADPWSTVRRKRGGGFNGLLGLHGLLGWCRCVVPPQRVQSTERQDEGLLGQGTVGGCIRCSERLHWLRRCGGEEGWNPPEVLMRRVGKGADIPPARDGRNRPARRRPPRDRNFLCRQQPCQARSHFAHTCGGGPSTQGYIV